MTTARAAPCTPGGVFTTAGGNPASLIAKWDGNNWSPVGAGISGIDFPFVRCLTTYDPGSGSLLIAGGTFTTAGGAPANLIAAWDGSNWSPLGSGLSGLMLGYAAGLGVFDDGNGPALYATGRFSQAGGNSAYYIAKWDGSDWAALGSGLGDAGRAMCAFDDGSGAALYVGGTFTTAGGNPANYIAKWDASNWSALAEGVAGDTAPYVHALLPHETDAGPTLVVGGYFTSAGTTAAERIALWRCDQQDRRADSNCDGFVNFDDINCFVQAIVDESQWETCGHEAGCEYLEVNDINRDGYVTFDDINPFVTCLVDGCPD